MQIKLHRHFDIVLKKYWSRLKIEKYLFTNPTLYNVFPFKKKINFIYFDDKTHLGKMLLKHENGIDKVLKIKLGGHLFCHKPNTRSASLCYKTSVDCVYNLIFSRKTFPIFF